MSLRDKVLPYAARRALGERLRCHLSPFGDRDQTTDRLDPGNCWYLGSQTKAEGVGFEL